MPYGDTYTVRHSASVSTAITVVQIAAGTAVPLLFLSGSATQRGSTTSAQEEMSFVRKTAAATVTAAVVGTHVFKRSPNAPSPSLQLGTALTGVIATVEGTDGDILWREAFNVLNGYKYLPVPEERIIVAGGGIIGLKFFTAPAAQNWSFQTSIMELG